MTNPDTHRAVSIRRTAAGKFLATNVRGGKLVFGSGGDDTAFTPVELLLAAIGGCASIDVDILTSRRAEPDAFEVTSGATMVRDGGGSHLTDIDVEFRVRFPAGAAGDSARAIIDDVIRRTHERLCTVSRTVELGTPVAMAAAPQQQ